MEIVTLRTMTKSDIRLLTDGGAYCADVSNGSGASAYRMPFTEIAFVDAALDDSDPGLDLIGSHADIFYVNFADSVADARAVLNEYGTPDSVHIIAADDGSMTSADARSAVFDDGGRSELSLFIARSARRADRPRASQCQAPTPNRPTRV